MKKIAENFEIKFSKSTPSFIFDLDSLKEHLEFLRKEINGKKLCYAMKANPILTDFIANFVDRIEVCSEGEFEICKIYKIPAEKIFYTGINKSKQEIENAWRYGVRYFNAESLNQLEMLVTFGEEIQIFPRLSNDSQFGINEKELSQILPKYAKNIAGLHYFGGTFRDKKLNFDLEKLRNFLKDYNFAELEFGPGFGVKYFNSDQLKSNKERLKQLNENLENLNLPITLEMGRFIVANCGLYVTKVVDIKSNNGVNYAILDGGLNHLNYYGQMLGMKNPCIYHFGNSEPQNYCLCGSICSMADVLVRNANIGLKIGDNLYFSNVGAYTSTEASFLFLSRPMPKIYLHKNSEFKLVRNEIESYKLNLKEF